jgi:hypothetical protein
VNLIALNGRAAAGKDTAADILVRYAHFQKLAFADALRGEVADAFSIGAMGRLLQDRELKEKAHDALALRHCSAFGFIGAVAMATRACVNSEWLDAPRSPRQILQWWGTEYRRAQDPRHWVKAMNARITQLREDPRSRQRFVITDCRFPNEYAYVKTAAARVWRIERAGLPDVENGHASASALESYPVDSTIANDGDLLALRGQVLRHWWAADSGIAAEKLALEVLE